MKRGTLTVFIFFSSALLPACNVLDLFGGGCETEGTVGAEGRAAFHFMQSDSDLSASSGNAFAVGTNASLGIEPAGGEDALPSWNAKSSDEAVFTVEEVVEEDEDYPVTLSMQAEGEAKLQVVGSEDDGIIDYVTLKVLMPDGLLAHVSHAVLGGEAMDETVALATGGAGCEIDFLVYSKEGTSESYLFGQFEVDCELEAGSLSLVHDPIREGNPAYSITIAAGTAGSYDLACSGPGDSSTSLTVLAVSPSHVEEFDLAFVPVSGDGEHTGDYGYLTGVQYASGVPLCSGHAVIFTTSDPYIASLSSEGMPEGIEDTVVFALQTSGVVRITAALAEYPAMQKSIDLVVQPNETY